ncbi:MAG TPA: YlxR family protein [Ilumatobacteraceae bacterium]|nr:YlxR family protein [Ilumatobacteraceae bacterium]
MRRGRRGRQRERRRRLSVAERPEPIRSCLGCRQRRPQPALVRVTKSATGIVVDGASDGRGAWICRSSGGTGRVEAACLDAAITRRAFARAWRVDVTPDDERAIRQRCCDSVDDEDE